MQANAATTLAEARKEAYSTPLEQLDVSRPSRFQHDTLWPFFARLRAEAPVHYCAWSPFGPYWSITRYDHIMYVDTHHELFSSEPGITILDTSDEFELPMFIAMDPPRHDEQRREVSPAVAPPNLANLEPLIRERVCRILDELPASEPFNWVEHVSIELTTQMLATLFDFPFEDRRRLAWWSDVVNATPKSGLVASEQARRDELMACYRYFAELWEERRKRPPANDFISMLAHGESTRNMPWHEYLGNLVLLIVGGNDTTRNSISGGVLALNQYPDEYKKLRENPELIQSMVPEIIRWQTPLAHMRRRATQDTELGGQRIRRGDKVVMWYVSGNRDAGAIDDPDRFIIDRPNPRRHLAFGYGIHRCMGNRLAEMQLRVLWEEILQRFRTVEVVGEPVRVHSNFVRGYSELPVKLHPW